METLRIDLFLKSQTYKHSSSGLKHAPNGEPKDAIAPFPSMLPSSPEPARVVTIPFRERERESREQKRAESREQRTENREQRRER